MPRSTREREISRLIFRGECRVDMTVEAERLPMTAACEKNNGLELEMMTHLLVNCILIVQLVDQ